MNDLFVAVRGITIHVEIFGDEQLPTLIFLHGFTGSTVTWREVIELIGDEYRVICVDLTGHGKTTVPNDPVRYSMEQQILDLEELVKTLDLDKFTLIGYSMGGRVALAYTSTYPERITTLILESSSPGLKTEGERIARKEADAKLADSLKTEGLKNFIDFWENISLFDTQKKLSHDKRLAIRNERLSQKETGLANSLLGIGTGSQPSYWDELSTIKCPVLLVTGEFDKKFVDISREMQLLFPFVRHETIKQAGHAIHVEKSLIFATMIKEHISCEKN